MELTIRRLCVIRDESYEEAGRRASDPLCKVGVVAVVENRYVGRYVADLRSLIEGSAELGRTMAQCLVTALGPIKAWSYGKAAIVGTAGEQEHANAVITSTFADPIRTAIGGGRAWISSITKVSPMGTLVDIPLNHKDEIYVRSHYDAMTIGLTDFPRPDEIAVIFCVANRGRLNARVGGLSHEEAIARSGASS
jgi:amino acid synthesis protein